MSASDAAPLPRLGEVFFDVRGHSRSMRLSWYADTDIAVFSIWQGGKCTGTFRLPMDDLSRMIEVLQRGPQRHAARPADRGAVDRGAVGPVERGAGERGAGGRTRGPRAGGYDGGHEPGYPGAHDADGEFTMVQGSSAAGADYDAGAYGPGQQGSGQYGTGDYSSRDYGSADYGPGDYGSADYGPSDYGPGDYGPGDYGSADHGSPGYGNYGPGDQYPDPDQRYEAADYGQPGHWRDAARYPADVTGERSGRAEADGYGQQRFVPPYVGPEPDASELGFFDESEYRQPADPAGRSRHSAGRHSSRPGQ